MKCLAATAVIAALLPASIAGAAQGLAAERHALQLEQQGSALDLSLQHHGARARSLGLASSDARRVDDLAIRQRLDQQLLEQQQALELRMLEREPSAAGGRDRERRLALQRDLFRQERELQVQRFELDQNRLMRSLAREPLQPRAAPGTLRLP